MHANYICEAAITACNPYRCAMSERREWNHPSMIAAHYLMRSRPPDLAHACCEYWRQAVKELLTAFSSLICADRRLSLSAAQRTPPMSAWRASTSSNNNERLSMPTQRAAALAAGTSLHVKRAHRTQPQRAH
jgi:hypothetical protein